MGFTFKSRTTWGAICVFVGGGLIALGLTEIGTALTGLGAALGFVGIRFAK